MSTVFQGRKWVACQCHPSPFFLVPCSREWLAEADGKTNGSNDTPSLGIDGFGVYEFSGTFAFQDWLVYIAPGPDSAPVPLMKGEWKWEFSYYTNQGVWTKETNDVTVTAVAAATTAFPQWTSKLTGSGQIK